MTTTTVLAEIQQRLRSLSDPSNTAFFEKMVPGKQKVYGVKTPDLNAIVQQYKVVGIDLVKAHWQCGALEEKIIGIKIMEKTGKKDPDKVLPLFKQFSKEIDN